MRAMAEPPRVFRSWARSSPGADRCDPSLEALHSLVDAYAHAIEINNRNLALWYVHPRSPWRSQIDAALRDQLASYLERALTSDLEPVPLPDGTISATVDQEFGSGLWNEVHAGDA
jgi:AcrR family transcriptional regulator